VYGVLPLQAKFILTRVGSGIGRSLFQENSGIGYLPEKFPCHYVLLLGLPGTAPQISLVVL
jgi:hypothetical protein